METPAAGDGTQTNPANDGDLSENRRSHIKDQDIEAQGIDAQNTGEPAVQQKVQQLITLIKTSLEGDQLSPLTQKELARLLSLTPQLDHRHTQQLNLLELAVSTLLEPDDKDLPGETRRESKNLVFAQQTRQQIVQQSCPQPNLIKSILSGQGTPYIRLISGLSWFFLFFVIAPMVASGAFFFIRDLAGISQKDEVIASLAQEKKFLEEEKKLQQQQVDILNNLKNILSTSLNETSNRLGTQINSLESSESSSADESSNTDQPNIELQPINVLLTELKQDIDDRLVVVADKEAEQLAEVTVQRKQVEVVKKELEEQASGKETSSQESSQSDASLSNTTETLINANDVKQQIEGFQERAISEAQTATQKLFKSIPYSVIVTAISMGALGSSISVIVRANTFINQAQESDNDLFLTGFFRPLVGMSFAIFCVALVEAGIFSGVFDLTQREEDRTYLYVAIAFIAGFSERLVHDVVSKTEDTLAGPQARP